MSRDIVFFTVILLLGVLVFIALMRRRRHKNSLPVEDPEPTIVRLTRHLDDL